MKDETDASTINKSDHKVSPHVHDTIQDYVQSKATTENVHDHLRGQNNRQSLFKGGKKMGEDQFLPPNVVIKSRRFKQSQAFNNNRFHSHESFALQTMKTSSKFFHNRSMNNRENQSMVKKSKKR